MIFSALKSQYAVEMVDSAQQLREAQRLRYQVYVLERGFEPATDLEPLETDKFDADARHLILRHRGDREVIGTARLIMGMGPNGPSTLHLEEHCASGILDSLPRRGLAEISRFALSSQRRRIGSPPDSLLRLALMQGVLEMSLSAGLTHWCALMEPSLIRLMRATGVHFTPLGAPIQLAGLRQPCAARIEDVLAAGRLKQPKYFKFVAEALLGRSDTMAPAMAVAY